MSSIDLMVNNDKYKCDLHLTQRVSIVHGDSAKGKSLLVEMFINSPSNVSCNKRIIVVNRTTWESVIRGANDALVVFDEINVVRSEKFWSLVNEHCRRNGLWFLIFSREILRENCKNLSDVTSAVYEFQSDGTEHWIENEEADCDDNEFRLEEKGYM